jgi:hypothetical protein
MVIVVVVVTCIVVVDPHNNRSMSLSVLESRPYIANVMHVRASHRVYRHCDGKKVTMLLRSVQLKCR